MKAKTRLSFYLLLLLPFCANAQHWYKNLGKGLANRSFELANGNILVWAQAPSAQIVPESFFLVLSADGDFIERIDFQGEGFAALKQNPNGSFDALGAELIAPNSVAPTWYHLSPGFEIMESANLGLDAISISGNPYSVFSLENAFFHANGDFTIAMNVNGPGVGMAVARFNSNKTQLWLNNNTLSESLSYTFKEDFAGNYLLIANGSAASVGIVDANWNTIWGKNLSTPVNNSAYALPNGNTLVASHVGGFNNTMLLDGGGNVISSPTTSYPTFDYDGMVNAAGDIVLTGTMVNTDLFQSGNHLRFADSNGDGITHYWLGFDNVRFWDIIQMMDGGYLVLGNELVTNPNQPVQLGDMVAARTLPSGQLYEGQIQGIVTVESDADCTVVPNDPEFPNFKIITQGTNNAGAVSGSNGTFILPLHFDDYTVTLVPPSPFWDVCDNDVSVTLDAAAPSVTLPFLVHANANCPYPEVSIGTQWLRRCFSNRYYYSVRNFGSEALVGAELVLSLDAFMAFEDASWPVVSQNGGEVRLAVPDVPPFGWATGHTSVLLTCDAQLGQEHCLGAEIQQLPACLDDHLPFSTMECRQNTGSYDPNDLHAFADGHEVPSHIFDEKEIEYLVNFQNTGTDTAFQVVVEDLLPTELDLTTLELGASSHIFQAKLEGRLLKFIFDDILLPDSTIDGEGSKGFVKFKVKMREGLQIGDSIANQVNIFFDFNAPVTTNKVTLVLSEFFSSNEPKQALQLSISPNPMSNIAKIVLSDWKGTQPVQLMLFDALGQPKMLLEQTSPEFTIQSDGLTPGVYFMQLVSEGIELSNGKLVVVGK